MAPVVDQQAHGGNTARARCGHQRCFALGVGEIGIGAGLEQDFGHRRVAGPSRLEKRRDPVVIGKVQIGAGSDENLGHLDVEPVGRPEQRRGSVARWCVYILVRRDEVAETNEIARPDGVGHRTILSSPDDRATQYSHRKEHNSKSQTTNHRPPFLHVERSQTLDHELFPVGEVVYQENDATRSKPSSHDILGAGYRIGKRIVRSVQV